MRENLQKMFALSGRTWYAVQRGQRHADIDVCAREQQVRAIDGGGGVRGHGGARQAHGVEAVAER